MDKFRFYNAERVEERAVTELIGIARGMIADGVINEMEADFLVQWMRENGQSDAWPFNVVNRRIAAILEDGVIDEEERKDLFAMLSDLTGGKPIDHVSSMATTLPLTKPEPEITFEGKTFCFTGKFAFGRRADCEKSVKMLGGICKADVVMSLDYLVIGMMGNEDWRHSSFGSKIEKAMKFNDGGCSIAIISEDAWANALVKTQQ